MLRTVCVGLAVLLAQAQTPPRPVFRSQTRLVQISVVVHDRHGQPVTDLKKEDFAIAERGKPQQITFFSMESASAVAPPSTLPPHIFTNVASKRMGVPGNVTVILLDLLNTSWGDQHYARDALLKFLGQIQPQDRIALFSLGRRSLTVLHDYTSDAASLAARIRKLNGEVSPELEASTVNDDTQQELQQLGLGGIADGNQQAADFFTGARAVNTLQAFEAIAQHLAGLPGRKSIIWLSGGFPLTIGFDEIPEPGSTREILGLGFPVFSTGAYAQDQRLRGRVIDFRCAIEFENGAQVRPGDLIVGDVDGVLAVPRDHVAEIVRLAFAKVEGEDRVRGMIDAGQSTLDIFEKTGIM